MLLDHAIVVPYISVQILAFSALTVYYLSVFYEPNFSHAAQYSLKSDTLEFYALLAPTI